jgi:hypothetical protein
MDIHVDSISYLFCKRMVVKWNNNVEKRYFLKTLKNNFQKNDKKFNMITHASKKW